LFSRTYKIGLEVFLKTEEIIKEFNDPTLPLI